MTTTATNEAAPAPALDVVLADGGDANLFAGLLKQHIDAIVAGEPKKADEARRINGKLGLDSTEPPSQATLVFDGERVTIKNGIDADVDATIKGTLKLQTETLVGQANPYAAMLKRKLSVGIKWRRPLFSAQTYRFLIVPPSMRPPKA